MNIKQIIEAFIIAKNPTPQQRELANLRGEICENCDSKMVKMFTYCKECGCLIDKKIFTNDFDPCPLRKWKEVDKPYFPEQKEKKTLL